jgi:predicted SAM-dependent methyltransferase
MKIFGISAKISSNGISVFIPKSRSNTYDEKKVPNAFQILSERIKPIKLNIGGGKGHPHVDGWQVVDIRSHADVVLDISKQPLPFVDDSVDTIFCSHTLEHIIPQRLNFVLSEFYRVMNKENSLLRIIVPDISKALKAYHEKDETFFDHSEISPNYLDAPLGGKLASWFYSTRIDKKSQIESDMKGHVHCFDYDYMKYCLNKNRFDKVWESNYRSSIFQELQGKDFDRYPLESIFVETVLQE